MINTEISALKSNSGGSGSGGSGSGGSGSGGGTYDDTALLKKVDDNKVLIDDLTTK